MRPTPAPELTDPGSARVQLRSDLRFHPRAAGRPGCLIEDPARSRFFRVGRDEYFLISLLDGVTVREAFARLCEARPQHQLDEQDAVTICRWLIDSKLAHGADEQPAPAEPPARPPAAWNPLVFRLPLGSPDRVLAALQPWLGWLYGRAALVAWLLLLLLAVSRVLVESDRFASSSRGIFAPSNWLWLAACWLGLKVVHEVSHGLVCRRYGGEVRQWGVLLVLLAPLAFVDVTSSWRFRSRWQRIHVAAAGMYSELLLAAVAALVWSATSSPWLGHLCYSLVIAAGVTTLLFNLNPLMKFDGYYLLSDLTGVANLSGEGQRRLRHWCRRHLLGLPSSLPACSPGKELFISVYAVAALLWRIMVCACLVIAAAAMFHGLGMVLAAAAVGLWIALPALRLAHYLYRGRPGERPDRTRLLCIAGLGSAALAALLALAPWPGQCRAPAVVEFAPLTVVRSSADGFVRQVHVRNGQLVEQGQLLAVMENPELEAQRDDLRLALQQCDARRRQFQQQGLLAKDQAEQKQRESLQQKIADCQARLKRLSVRAPRGGQVIGRQLESLAGVFLEEGDELLSIGREDRKELRLSISQDDLAAFAGRTGELVRVEVPGLRPFRATLTQVIPRATRTPRHAALTAANGGPLAVRETEDGEMQWFAPRLAGVAPLTAPQSRRLAAGRRASVAQRPFNEPLGAHLYHAVARWVRRRLQK